MAYITVDDFKTFVQELILDEIIEEDDLLLDTAIALAEEEIFSYLNQRYDATAELALQGDERNKSIVKCAVDIALYHLMSRISPNQVPTVRNDRYADSVAYLKDIAMGNINPRLAVKTDPNTDDQTALFRMGSNTKFNSEY